jgi:hypothetical protein
VEVGAFVQEKRPDVHCSPQARAFQQLDAIGGDAAFVGSGY